MQAIKKATRPLPETLGLRGFDKLALRVARRVPEIVPMLYRAVTWSSRLMNLIRADRSVQDDDLSALIEVGGPAARDLLLSSRRGFRLIDELPAQVPLNAIRQRWGQRIFEAEQALPLTYPAPGVRADLAYFVRDVATDRPALLPAVLSLICNDEQASRECASYAPGLLNLDSVRTIDAIGRHLVERHQAVQRLRAGLASGLLK